MSNTNNGMTHLRPSKRQLLREVWAAYNGRSAQSLEKEGWLFQEMTPCAFYDLCARAIPVHTRKCLALGVQILDGGVSAALGC